MSMVVTRKILVCGVVVTAAFAGVVLLSARSFAQDKASPPSSQLQVEQLQESDQTQEQAQEEQVSDIDRILKDEQMRIGLQESFQRKAKLRQPDVANITELKTMFFTKFQHQALQDAKRLGLTRPPTPVELPGSNSITDRAPVGRGLREISLGGILYSDTMEWTIWLNGVRVTPKAIPKEVLDIKVRKDFIDIKWYDAFSNVIYPVRLRSHQRFNLDNRMFLPGEGVASAQ